MPPRERVAGETPTAVPVPLRLSRVVFCFLRVLRVLCGFPSPCSLWFSFSGLLTPEISPAREDFHAATRASCRRDPNHRPRSVAALSRCVSFSPCPLCPLWFSFPGPLTPEIFPAREDFHAATRASCRPDPNRRRRLVAALSRCVSVSPCPLCPLWFSFSGPLTPEIFPAREDFHAATGASCRRDPNHRPRSVAALSRCVLFSPCPLCPLWFSFPVSSVVFLLRTTNL